MVSSRSTLYTRTSSFKKTRSITIKVLLKSVHIINIIFKGRLKSVLGILSIKRSYCRLLSCTLICFYLNGSHRNLLDPLQNIVRYYEYKLKSGVIQVIKIGCYINCCWNNNETIQIKRYGDQSNCSFTFT